MKQLLGKGLASQLRVLGGEILYEDYTGNVPFMQAQSINGLRLPVIGGSVHRTEDKRIRGHVEIAKAAALMFVGENELADSYDFFSASEYISDDPEHPSIFQNLVNYTTPAGKRLTFPGLGLIPMPFEISCSAFTEAAGYIKGGKFVGVAQLAFEFNLSKVPPQIRALMSARFGTIPDFAHMRGAGRFEISLSQDI